MICGLFEKWMAFLRWIWRLAAYWLMAGLFDEIGGFRGKWPAARLIYGGFLSINGGFSLKF
jgi:hypothetical protein